MVWQVVVSGWFCWGKRVRGAGVAAAANIGIPAAIGSGRRWPLPYHDATMTTHRSRTTNRSTLAGLATLAALLLASAPAAATELLGVSDTAAPTPREARRLFNGPSFHTHFELGGVWGQQDLAVSTANEDALVTGVVEEAQASASGVGLATRLELWPVYGRWAGVGVYGAGHVGGLRRGGAGTGVLGGSTGLLATVGPQRLRALGMVGRSWRGGAYGEGVSWTKAVDPEATEVTVGAERVRAYRAGVGVRTAFDRTERRGLDVWLMWDEPTSLRAGDAPVVSLPSRGQSAMLLRSSVWLRNAVAISAEVTVRDNPAVATPQRSALVSLSWSLDRFARYGGGA